MIVDARHLCKMVGTTDSLRVSGMRASDQTILNNDEKEHTHRSFGVAKRANRSGRNSQEDAHQSRDSSVRAVLNLNFQPTENKTTNLHL
jgi:hypothetical protein